MKVDLINFTLAIKKFEDYQFSYGWKNKKPYAILKY